MRKHIARFAVLAGCVVGGWLCVPERNHELHARTPTTGTCSVAADTRLEQKNPDHAYGQDPSLGLTLYGAGNVNSVGHFAEAALRFECPDIPPSSTIVSASLDIYVTNGTSDTYDLYELKKPWTESAATWNHYDAGAPWAVPGARDTGATSPDLAKPLLGTFTAASAGATRSIPLTAAGISVVSGWVNGGTNTGILLRPPLNDDDVGFHSKENTGGNAAVLEVTSTTGPYTLPLLADTRLEEKLPNTNYASHSTLYGAGNVNNIGQLAEAALRFDLSGVAAGTTIQTAKLRIYVSFTTADTYELFELKKPWTETGATWMNYASGAAWDVPGAKGANDRGSTILGAFTGAAAGTRLIDLNAAGVSLVNGWLNGTPANNGILLRSRLTNNDVGFHSQENVTPPVLRVTYETGSSATTFTALHWNIHHGTTPSNVCVIDDMTSFVAQSNASIVGLNEVEYLTGWCGAMDEPGVIEQQLETKTGRQWSRLYAPIWAFVEGNGNKGNLILYMSNTAPQNDPRPGFALVSQDTKRLDNEAAGDDRSAGRVTLRNLANSSHVVTFVSTHLIVSNLSMAQLQAAEVRDWVAAESEARIIAGDWNATPGTGPVNEMTPTYFDAYAVASSFVPSRYTGFHSNGGTRPHNTNRIDYHFYSKQSVLEVLAMNVPKPLASNGQDISDHLPVIVTYRLP